MSEFVQTMKDWKRMCSAMEKLRPDDSCNGCRVEGYGCPAIYEDDSHVDYADVQNKVAVWAAEHPEPQYPTWGEYLASIGVMKPAQPDKAYEVWFTQLYSTNIPADIAHKLGIEPKEGTTWAR